LLAGGRTRGRARTARRGRSPLEVLRNYRDDIKGKQGKILFEMDLSHRRAAAVVAALATRYSIAKDRLTPVGVSFASPVAPNKTEEGRAKNRRVELVESAVATGTPSRNAAPSASTIVRASRRIIAQSASV
jgi:hypothetical protein